MTGNSRFLFLLLVCIALAFRRAAAVRGESNSSTHTIQDLPSMDGAPVATTSSVGICKSRVEIFGYSCEEHMVTTDDGYMLSLQRIPNGHSDTSSVGNKIPVLLQHGLVMDGITWLLNSPDESLAYILADNGYDVWIANTRGTLFSQGHTSFTPDDPAYWDWTWDELVEYDLPATFKYVHDQTSQNLHYVGHSLGTLIALASFCQQKLISMLRSAALLSPIAYVNQITSPLAKGAADSFVAETVFWLGLKEFNPRGKAITGLLKALCKEPGTNCFDLMAAFTGKNCCLNSSAVDVFLEHEPQSTATKNMIHIAQMIRDGTIMKFDYEDPDENMKHYGQPTPPLYDMSGIPNDVPLLLSYGGEDALSDVNDVKHLLNILKSHNSDMLTVQYVDNYAHADFVMATNANEVVYEPLMGFFKLH